MAHLILPLMVVSLGLSWWLAVYYAPGVLSRILPRNLTFMIGTGFFVFGALGAVTSVYGAHDPKLMLSSFIQCFVGTWYMLAPSAALRGDPEDDRMVQNLAIMLASGAAVLVLSLYLRQPAAQAFLQLWLVLFGSAVALRPRLWSR